MTTLTKLKMNGSVTSRVMIHEKAKMIDFAIYVTKVDLLFFVTHPFRTLELSVIELE